MNKRRDYLKTSGSLLGFHHHAREYEVIEGKIMMDYFVVVEGYNFNSKESVSQRYEYLKKAPYIKKL